MKDRATRADCACNQGRIVHRGLHRHRFADNPEEKRFADAWEGMPASGNLPWLLTEGDQGPSGPEPISPRDAAVAATVVQWLGSPVGLSFLRGLGYEKKAER